MSYTPDFARYLVDNGLLFEINRKVLHPLGLALIVDVSEENRKKLIISGLMQVEPDDKEGFVFDEESFSDGNLKFQKYLETIGEEKLKNREESLGYLLQGEKSDEI